jgi:hypothetical protein
MTRAAPPGGIAILAVLQALACSPKPSKTPESRGTGASIGERWDGTREVFDDRGDRLFIAGPLWRVARATNDMQGADDWVTERCWRIAHGVPFLHESMPEVTFGFDRLHSFWKTQTLAQRDLCREAYGDGWGLPTREELLHLAERGTLPGGPWFSRAPSRALVAVEFQPGPVLPSIPPQKIPDRICLEPRPEAAGVLCTSNAESSALQPSDAEIRKCVIRLDALADPDLDATSALPAAYIDLVLDVHHACQKRGVAEWSRVVGVLERRAAGLKTPQRDVLIEHRDLSARVAQLERAARVASSKLGDSCDVLRANFGRECQSSDTPRASSCLAIQVAHAVQCRDGAALEARLEAALARTRARTAALRTTASGRPLLRVLVQQGRRCLPVSAPPPPAHQSFQQLARRLERLGEALRGPRGPDSAIGEADAAEWSDLRACDCPLEDVDCGIAAIEDPDRCKREKPPPKLTPSSPTPVVPSRPCKCAPGDLQCQMRCPRE